MRFLADESCDFRIVVALRTAGHDVAAVAQEAPGSPDLEVIRRAQRENRVVLTEDRDFGRLVFSAQIDAGVLYIRCPEAGRQTLAERIVRLVDKSGSSLMQSFVVWTPGRTRTHRLRRT